MAANQIGRKRFLTVLGRVGAGACMCGAALGAERAFADDPEGRQKAQTPEKPEKSGTAPQTRPGDKSDARAVKRMEFVDGWVPRFFAVLDAHLDEPTRRRIMAANGKACFSAWAPTLKPRVEPASKERIAAWVAGRAQQGYRMEGDAIVSEYLGSAETGQPSPEHVCLCPTAEAQGARQLSPTYCWCSVGYVKELHERVFGRRVNVELVQSVLMGHPRCRFRITLA
jgi:hypothetical protein